MSDIDRAISNNKNLEGPLLPILHEVQTALGYVPKEAVPLIAKSLNLSRAEVHGVITFYDAFHEHPRANTVIEVCRAESCQAVGGRAIEAALKDQLGIDFEQTTADGKITLEPVYCLGNCGCSPALRVGEDVYGRLTPASVPELLTQLRSKHTGESA